MSAEDFFWLLGAAFFLACGLLTMICHFAFRSLQRLHGYEAMARDVLLACEEALDQEAP